MLHYYYYYYYGLENENTAVGDPSRWPRGTLYQQTLALTSPTSGGRSVGIVHSRTQATEFFYVGFTFLLLWVCSPFVGHSHFRHETIAESSAARALAYKTLPRKAVAQQRRVLGSHIVAVFRKLLPSSAGSLQGPLHSLHIQCVSGASLPARACNPLPNAETKSDVHAVRFVTASASGWGLHAATMRKFPRTKIDIGEVWRSSDSTVIRKGAVVTQMQWNASSCALPLSRKGQIKEACKLSPQQAVQCYSVLRCWGSHTTAVKLSAPEALFLCFWYSFLLEPE
jgi:hypothetical protein